ncbi:flagellar biosynthesis protein FlhF [Clostridium tetanomorphum]|nr:flagellar biosynthesis protein FlhF [Clostridium tetanomorphum]NRS85114.1 flagellar biosynthesis protein FlhF [Clostridium tetanomorphum]
MIIKKYIVNNMNEAMTRIRYELGKDAIIISQRKVRKPGFLGFFQQKVMEVTAAVDNSKKEKENAEGNGLELIKKLIEKKEEKKCNEQSEQIHRVNDDKKLINTEVSKLNNLNNKADKSKEDLVREIQEMKKMMNDMMSHSLSLTKEKSKLQILLDNSDINEKTSKGILMRVKNINNSLDDIEKAKIVIKEMIPISRAKLDDIVVLVGPTGVGKTTTIAKLAGNLALIQKKKVGLITIDTYRIGAVEQLRTYADIMNIPFKVVLSIKEMEEAINSMQECDTILVDTTGRSSKNAMQISELRAFIQRINSQNIHLVVSCTTKNKDIDTIIEGYKPLGYNNNKVG